MASLNPSSDISGYIQTIYESVVLVARDNNVMTQLVRTFNDRSGVAVRDNSQYGGMTINTIGETDDMVGQSFTPSSIATITPSEAGGQYMLTRTRVESDPYAVRNDAAADMGQAMATKIEKDLIGNFTSFTAGTIGAAGSAITWSYLFNMEALLRNAKAPYPYFALLHPYQWNVLAKAASVASSSATNAAPSLLEAVNSMYFVKQVGGIYIFVSSNITPDGSDDAYCGMWSRDAIALDVRRAPMMEVEYDSSRRAWELNIHTLYGHGVWRPTFGAAGLFDAATPTT